MGEPTQIGVKIRAALAVLGASQDMRSAYVDVSVPTNPWPAEHVVPIAPGAHSGCRV